MIATIVYVDVLPEFVEAFEEITRYNHENSRKEPGNVRFDVLHANNDPTKFILYEVFADKEAAAGKRYGRTVWPGSIPCRPPHGVSDGKGRKHTGNRNGRSIVCRRRAGNDDGRGDCRGGWSCQPCGSVRIKKYRKRSSCCDEKVWNRQLLMYN